MIINFSIIYLFTYNHLFLEKPKIHVTIQSSNSTLPIPKELEAKPQSDSYTPMFITALSE